MSYKDFWKGNPPYDYFVGSNQGGSKMKIQISRVKLIAALEAKLQELQSTKTELGDIKLILDKYEQELEHGIKQYRDRLEKYRKAPNKLELREAIEGTRGTCSMPSPPSLNPDPYLDNKIEKLNSKIKKLKLSDQEVMEVEENDDYLQSL